MLSGLVPLVAPDGTDIEVTSSRAATLLGRGYSKLREPSVRTEKWDGAISLTASVPHTPWDEARATQIAAYEIPDLDVVSDNDREGCWPTVRKCWERGPELGGTHHLVLTDDLRLAEGFWQALQRAIRKYPHAVISLLSVVPGAKVALDLGASWCMSWGVTGAANVIPTYRIPEYLEWQDRSLRDDCPHDDVRLSAWLTCLGEGSLTPVPGLIQHGDLPSVIEDSPVYGMLHGEGTTFIEDATNENWEGDVAFIGVSLGRRGIWLRNGHTLKDIRENKVSA